MFCKEPYASDQIFSPCFLPQTKQTLTTQRFFLTKGFTDLPIQIFFAKPPQRWPCSSHSHSLAGSMNFFSPHTRRITWTRPAKIHQAQQDPLFSQRLYILWALSLPHIMRVPIFLFQVLQHFRFYLANLYLSIKRENFSMPIFFLPALSIFRCPETSVRALSVFRCQETSIRLTLGKRGKENRMFSRVPNAKSFITVVAGPQKNRQAPPSACRK